MVSDVQNNTLTLGYQSKNSLSLDSDYLHEVCLEQFRKMSDLYRGFNIENSEVLSEDSSDYVLSVQITRTSSGWSVHYTLDSIWVQNAGRSLLDLKYQDLTESHLIYTTRRVFDEIIYKIYSEPGIFEYPTAYIEKVGETSHLVLSDLLYQFKTTVYETGNILSEILWDHHGEGLFFTELTSLGTQLNYLDLNTKRVNTLYTSSLISSPILADDSENLYFVADFTHVPHMYQLNRRHHQLKALTWGPLWVSEIQHIPNTNEFSLTTNRSGQPQVYRFNPLKKTYERISFSKKFAGNGIVSTNGDIFYISLDDNKKLSVFRKVLSSGELMQITSEKNVHKMALARNPTLLSFTEAQDYNKEAIGFVSLKDGKVQYIKSNNSQKSLVFSKVPNLYSLMKK